MNFSERLISQQIEHKNEVLSSVVNLALKHGISGLTVENDPMKKENSFYTLTQYFLLLKKHHETQKFVAINSDMNEDDMLDIARHNTSAIWLMNITDIASAVIRGEGARSSSKDIFSALEKIYIVADKGYPLILLGAHNTDRFFDNLAAYIEKNAENDHKHLYKGYLKEIKKHLAPPHEERIQEPQEISTSLSNESVQNDLHSTLKN